jgi:hypothetical protein
MAVSKRAPQPFPPHRTTDIGLGDRLVDEIAARLAPELESRVAALLLPQLAAAMEKRQSDQARHVSLSEAAAMLHVHPEVLTCAVKLPSSHAGFLASSVTGSGKGAAAGREMRSIRVADLWQWHSGGGLLAARNEVKPRRAATSEGGAS